MLKMMGKTEFVSLLALCTCYILGTSVYRIWITQGKEEVTKRLDGVFTSPIPSVEAAPLLGKDTSTSKQSTDPNDVVIGKTTETTQWFQEPFGTKIVSDISLIPDRKSKRVNCEKLFSTNESDAEVFRDAMRIHQSLSLQPEDIEIKANNCDKFIMERGYIMDSMTQEEEDFPIAFSMVMYTDPGQAERLLRAIYRPQNYYCIHVDIKANETTKSSMQAIADCFKNVFIAPHPTSVYWGEFGELEAEFICMRYLVKYKWKYFINLTGHEFPLVSNYKIVKVLKVYNGANEIANEVIGKHLRQRWELAHSHGKLRSGPQRKDPLPANITIYKGSAHVVLNRRFVDYILKDPIAQQFLNWTKLAASPEEIFFSSLQYNTHLKAPGAFKEHHGELHDLVSRHKVWMAESGWKHCASKKFRNFICIPGVGDLKYLRDDQHAFFINKLIDDFQPATFDCLEELHANRTREEYEGEREVDLTLHEQLPLVHNHN